MSLQVLQMIGRAGRPGFDTEAKAVVMVQEEKKLFYMKVSCNIRRCVPSKHLSSCKLFFVFPLFGYASSFTNRFP
jgi:replicative superfamily II helicase